MSQHEMLRHDGPCYDIGPMPVEELSLDHGWGRIVIPDDITARECGHLTVLLTLMVAAQWPSDPSSYIIEHGLQRLFPDAEKGSASE